MAGRTAEAIALGEATLKLSVARFGPDQPLTLKSRNNLAAAYESVGRWADAEPLWRENIAGRRRAGPPGGLPLAGDLAGLGRALLQLGKWSEAEAVLREGLTIQSKARPDDWSRFHARRLLGGALAGRGRYGEAEPPIVKGYEGPKDRAARVPRTAPPFLPEAAGRVVRLYEAWGMPERAAAWKAKLGPADLPADVFAKP